MIRLFNVYYPIRVLVLLIGDALVVWTSLLVAVVVDLREDSYLVLNYEGGWIKLFIYTAVVLLCSHWFDLYDTARFNTKGELFFRLFMLLGILSFVTAGISWIRPDFLWRGNSSVLGLLILTLALFGWRLVYGWLVQLPILAERVYVLGTTERAQRLVHGLRQNPKIGVEIAGWTGKLEGAVTREAVAEHLVEVVKKHKVHRVILAMPDRRGIVPANELLKLRMEGVKIEEATSWLERISGRIEIENLNPSWMTFNDGFRRNTSFIRFRRFFSIAISLVGLIIAAPLIPLIMLAIRLDSEGPALYTQTRMGKGGHLFTIVKFRTMRQDAEAANGPQWAVDNDPRVTRVGRFLRSVRLDDIPQLWCVLKGDMAIVGPRPEGPEFIEMLSQKIPFYGVRHMVLPGVTGWAQIKYKHVNTVEDALEELQYDLFYIKNASIGLDLLIMFQTLKVVLLLRGAQ